MKLSWYISECLDKDKNIDFNHIEYIEIIKEGVFLQKPRHTKKIKKGDIISIQYLSRDEIEVKINDKITIIDAISLSHGLGRVHWCHIYWHNMDNWNNRVFIYKTTKIERNNKLKKLCI